MKVLLLADVCNPNWASLPSFSHSLAMSISDNVDVVLVTHIRNKSDIDSHEYKFQEVIYIDNEYIASPLFKLSKVLKNIGIGGWMTNMALKYPSNIAFEREAYKALKTRINNDEFDFIHRISPVSPTVPSPIAKWAKTPFIYGPINGALPWPNQFKDEIKKEREILIHVRNFYKYLPYYKDTFKFSSKILAAFSHVEKDIPLIEHGKIIRFNELGVYTDQYKPREDKSYDKKGPCQFLFVGRLVPYKCPHIVISAFAQSKKLRSMHKLNIVGDGPEREVLQQLIDDNNLNDCVEILGWKNQVEVAEYMANSDVFVFPSIREVGGNVLIEAMSSGLPSIVPNYGGPSELIDGSVGIKIDLSDKKTFLDSYIKSMEDISSDVELRKKLSDNARLKALQEHDWTSKGKLMAQVYREAKSFSLDS